MISRKTIFSLILALLVLLLIRAWSAQHIDTCTRYLAGDRGFGPVQYFPSGSYMVAMDCRWWLQRQPAGVQAACLLDATLVVVFLLSVWADLRKWRARSALTPRRRGI